MVTMGSLEFLVHILNENHWVLLKFLYLDFGHLSLTPSTRVVICLSLRNTHGTDKKYWNPALDIATYGLDRLRGC